MRLIRFAMISISTAAFVGAAMAQFDGPAPLAWRWTQPTSVPPSGVPVVSGDMVYVAVGSRIFGLDRTSGNQRWKYPNVEAIPGAFRQGVQVIGDMVVAAADNKIIYAVDAKTGQAKWQYASPVPFQGAPVVAGKFVVVALNDNTLMAINGDDGTAAWQNAYKIVSGLEGSISTNGTNVYYMTGANDLVALSVLNAKQSWTKKFTSTSSDATPVLYGDMLYMNTGQFVACLNASTGGFRWQQNIGEPLMYNPAVSPDGVMVVSREGRARLYDATSGRPKWKNAVDLGSLPVCTPGSSGKTFVAPTSNGALNLISAATGEVLWSYLIRPIGGSLISNTTGSTGSTGGNSSGPKEIRIYTVPASGAPVLADSTLYVLATDGSLLAFDKSQGVDLTGPSVKMLWPNPGDQVSGQPPLELIFKIEDESTGVNTKTLGISINNSPCDFQFGRDGFAIVRISSIGKNRPLMNGRAIITVTVSDWIGNKTTSTYNLLIDNALKPLNRPTISGQGAGAGSGSGGPGKGGGAGG